MADTLREVVGELGKHLKIISEVMSVEVAQRGQSITVLGQDAAVELASTLLEQRARACVLVRVSGDVKRAG